MKWSLKSQKTRFFSTLFQVVKKASKKRVFCDFKDHFNLSDHQSTLKNIARILYDFCIFGILKKTHKFVKIGKTSGNTLDVIFWYGEIMSPQLICSKKVWMSQRNLFVIFSGGGGDAPPVWGRRPQDNFLDKTVNLRKIFS